MTPVAFNDYGEAEFNGWLNRYTHIEIDSATAAAYFNSISNFEDDEIVARIEFGSADTVNYRPAVFEVTREMVRYA